VARRYKISRRQAGFTLVELLISMVVLSIMLSIVYASFTQTSSAAAKAEAFMDLNHVSRFIISRITDDLASASLFANSGNGYFIGEAGETLDSFDGARMDKITFTGFGRRLATPGTASDQAVISWYAVKNPGQEDTYTLMRSESFNVLAKPEDDADQSSAPAFDITDRLVSFEISYQPVSASDTEWKDSFNSRQTRRLPTMISVKYTLKDDDGALITRSALIPSGESL